MHKFFLLIPLLLLSSCFDFIESYQFNDNGSGSANYILNLSQNKTIIATVLSKDSIQGYKIPSRQEIGKKLVIIQENMNGVNGINDCHVNIDWENYILKCDFKFTSTKALKEIQSKLGRTTNQNLDLDWVFDFNGKQFEKKLPPVANWDQSPKEFKDLKVNLNEINNANLTFIYRFNKEIATYDNQLYQLSGNKKAIMLKNAHLNNNQLNTNVIVTLK